MSFANTLGENYVILVCLLFDSLSFTHTHTHTHKYIYMPGACNYLCVCEWLVAVSSWRLEDISPSRSGWHLIAAIGLSNSAENKGWKNSLRLIYTVCSNLDMKLRSAPVHTVRQRAKQIHAPAQVGPAIVDLLLWLQKLERGAKEQEGVFSDGKISIPTSNCNGILLYNVLNTIQCS